MDIKVAVVVISRNEEKRIAKTLESIEQQTLKPYRTIVVNDGSTDSTGDIISKFDWVEQIDRQVRDKSYLGTKELAYTINAGLDLLHSDALCSYVCLSGADILYPKDYLRIITARMEEDQTVVTSGVIKDEFSIKPRGAGRVVQCAFWRKIGFRYPVNYGYEGYLLAKAESMGYKITVYPDMIISTQRKTGSRFDPSRYYYYGLGMRALGYRSSYALAKMALFATKNLRGAMHMWKGYYSNYDELYEAEVREYIKRKQNLSYNKLIKLFSSK